MKTFMIPFADIDREATRKRVEGHLETARIYKQMGFVRREMKITMCYESRVHGDTNKVSRPVEDTAAWNVDKEDRMRAIAESVDQAVEALGSVEREIIRRRYLQRDLVFDFNVYPELHISERQYYRLKAAALLKLAYMLSLEVAPKTPQTASARG